MQVSQTTTAVQFDEQDLSRHLLIELADSPDRTDVVLDLMGEAYSGQSDQREIDLIAETHREIHRRLPRGAAVNVPFAPVLARLLPRESITVLRAFRTIVSLIKASAVLHGHHRELDDEGRIVATVDDYRVVYEVAGEFISQSMSAARLPSPVQDWVHGLIERIAEEALKKARGGRARERSQLLKMGEEEFIKARRRWDVFLTLNDLIDLTGRPRTTVQRYLDQLASAGLVETEKRGRANTYRLATHDGELPSCPLLPSPEGVEREHVGTSHNLCQESSLGCPPQRELPTSEEESNASR